MRRCWPGQSTSPPPVETARWRPQHRQPGEPVCRKRVIPARSYLDWTCSTREQLSGRAYLPPARESRLPVRYFSTFCLLMAASQPRPQLKKSAVAPEFFSRPCATPSGFGNRIKVQHRLLTVLIRSSTQVTDSTD